MISIPRYGKKQKTSFANLPNRWGVWRRNETQMFDRVSFSQKRIFHVKLVWWQKQLEVSEKYDYGGKKTSIDQALNLQKKAVSVRSYCVTRRRWKGK